MKWVTAGDLNRWADTTGARTALSEIISALVRATARNLQSFRFPTGDSAQIPGYDGRLVAVGVPPYIPDGHSVWEFGVSDDYFGKANENFEERTEDPKGVLRTETTFVFVTPRTWRRPSPSLEEWCDTGRTRTDWKDVRVVDGVQLEGWLSEHDAVAAQVARQILTTMPATGARSIEEFWEEYSSRFKPSLTAEVLLCDREEQAKKLREDLLGPPQDLILRADSLDEAVAFLAAAVQTADDEIRKFLVARMLVVDTEEAARQVNRQSKIFVVGGTATRLGSWLSRSSVTVVPIGRDVPRRTGGMTVLNRPTSHSLAKALETMGFEHEAARQLARTCGRSVTVLARRIPRGDAGKPPWADGGRPLIPALLAGGWDAESSHDRTILSALAGGVPYADFEAELHRLERLQDPPIDREGGVWKIRAPVDAFVYLGHLIGRNDLERLHAAAVDVFREEDPLLDVPDQERPFAAIRNQRLHHSEWLRDGLATTLLLIAVLHEEAALRMTGGLTPQQFVDRVVEELPGLNRDHRLIASLQNELPLLMEAAPRPLLSALGRLLEGDGSKLQPIFQERGGLLAANSAHTGLLWALEAMAWDPEFLSEVAMILAKLARIDPGGHLANRPLNTLREIFLPWHPGTNATLVQRMAVLDQIVAREPSIGWSLLVALFPENHDFASPTVAPRYREAGASDREVLTWARVFEGYRAAVDRALRIVDDDVARWQKVIEEVHRFEPALRERTYELLEHFVRGGAGGQARTMWGVLRKTVNHHRAFRDTDWALRALEVERLAAVVRVLEPADVVERVAWLFEDAYPVVPLRDNVGRRDAVDLAREDAIEAVFSSEGAPGLVRLAEKATYPHYVAIAAENYLTVVDDYEMLVRGSLGKSERLSNLALALSGEARRRFGHAWQQRVQALASEHQWTPAELAILLFGWDDAPSTWDVAEGLGGEVADIYWRRKSAWSLRDPSPETLQRAVARYLAVGRAAAAFEAAHDQIERLPPDQIFAILDSLPPEIARAGTPPNSMFIHQLGETLKRLGALQHIPALEVAKREYALLPLFGYRDLHLTLYRVLADSPELFVSVLCDVFRPKSGERPEPTEDERARAQIGYRILSSFRIVPGRRGDEIDSDVLRNWIVEVRRRAEEADRIAIADEYIGHILAHTPHDPVDHAWPHGAGRDIIEELASEHVELGIQVERHNMRGVVSKAMFEGGGQERLLADEVRGWARSAAGWSRTSAMLLNLARSWDTTADREDERARQDQMRFE